MEKRKDALTSRQLLSIAGVGFLSPALRLIPGQNTELVGRAAWLSFVAAIPALLLLNWMISAVMSGRRSGEGMGGMVRRALGRTAGNIALLLFSAWLTFYAGFLLRSGADRFMTAIYPESSPAVFIVVMLLLSLMAALGRTRVLGRCSEIFLPLLSVTLAVVLIFAFIEFKVKNLLPVQPSDAKGVLLGAIPEFDIVSMLLLNTAFLEGLTPKDDKRTRRYGWLSVVTCLVMTALTAATIGRFGAEFTGNMSNSFFVLVRNTQLFGAVQRIESLVTAMWVFPDFVLTGFILILASESARMALGFPRRENSYRFTDLSNGRWVIWLVGALSLTAALTMASTDQELRLLSHTVVPGISMGFSIFGVALVLIIGKLRRKI